MDWNKYINETGEVIGFFGRYFFLSGLFYFIFYKWKKNRYKHLKIQAAYPEKKDIIREIAYSLLSLAIYCSISFVVLKLYRLGYTRVYLELNTSDIVYLPLSFLLIVMIHDAYFYWTHRLLHLNWFMRNIHYVHHLSTNPSPWASFAFHPAEALISALYLPLAIALIPLHPISIVSFLFYMTLINVMGHSGFEWFSERFRKSSFGKTQNTSSYHNLHHKKGRNNYGLYFTLWDKWMKTLEK